MPNFVSLLFKGPNVRRPNFYQMYLQYITSRHFWLSIYLTKSIHMFKITDKLLRIRTIVPVQRGGTLILGTQSETNLTFHPIKEYAGVKGKGSSATPLRRCSICLGPRRRVSWTGTNFIGLLMLIIQTS